MRLKWFKKLTPALQILVLAGCLVIFTAGYISLSKYLHPFTISLISAPLKFAQGLSTQAKYFLSFQDLVAENKRLNDKISQLNAEVIQLQESLAENRRLRRLLSLPQRKSFSGLSAFVVGRDSSNWTNTAIIDKGRLNGVAVGMPVTWGSALAGRITQSGAVTSKVTLITDFNSKVPALIQRSREQGLVFGAALAGKGVCKMKYIQGARIGDTVVTSGLAGMYPKGLLIGKVTAIEEGRAGLYKVMQISPAVDFSVLEEVLVIVQR